MKSNNKELYYSFSAKNITTYDDFLLVPITVPLAFDWLCVLVFSVSGLFVLGPIGSGRRLPLAPMTFGHGGLIFGRNFASKSKSRWAARSSNAPKERTGIWWQKESRILDADPNSTLYTIYNCVWKRNRVEKTDDSRVKSVEIVCHCDAISKPNAKTKRKESMRFLREVFRCWAKLRFQNMLEWDPKWRLGAQKYLTKIKISWNSKWREVCESVVKQWRRRHFSLHGWPGQVCRPLYRHKLTWNSRKPEDLSSLDY